MCDRLARAEVGQGDGSGRGAGGSRSHLDLLARGDGEAAEVICLMGPLASEEGGMGGIHT
jgi:hypothetical protein